MHTSSVRGPDGGNRALTHVIRQVDHIGEVTCLCTHHRKQDVAPAGHSTNPAVPSTHTATATTYLIVGYSTGVVSVYSCSSFRALWSTRVHDLDASVIELYVAGDILLTQSRAGEVKRWLVDWEGRRFSDGRRLDRQERGENAGNGEKRDSDDFDRVYSFSRMCCIPRFNCVAYPSRGGKVAVHNYDTDEMVELETTSYGMVTSLAGVACDTATGGIHGVMLVCVGYESGLVEVYDVRLGDGRGRLLCEISSAGTDPCVALGCCAAPGVNVVHVARGFAGDGTSGYVDNRAERETTASTKNPPLVHIGVVSPETGEDKEDKEDEEDGAHEGEGNASKHADRASRGHEDDPETGRYLYRHTASVMETPKGLTATLRGMDQIVYRDDGKYVAVACWDGKVRIYRTSTGKLVDVIAPVHGKQASTCIAFEQKRLVVGSRDGTVSIYHMK